MSGDSIRRADRTHSRSVRGFSRGAIDPRDGKKTVTPTVIDFDKARQFWSFQPPKNYPAPIVKQKNWVRRSIDPFILGKLEKTGLSPAPVGSNTEKLTDSDGEQ